MSDYDNSNEVSSEENSEKYSGDEENLINDNENNLDNPRAQELDIPKDGRTTILVTGGNGYLGSHIVQILLTKGVKVKVSVRDISKKASYSHLEKFENAADNLTIVEGELTNKDVWKDILKGCSAVIHVASPNPFKAPKQELEVIYPAVEGTLAILHAMKELGIKRIVMTSSVSAIKGGKYKLTYNEEAWGEPENVTAIEKSKIFAERSAWFFEKDNPKDIELTVINPGFLLGKCLQDHYEFSSGLFFKKFLDGRVTSVLKMHIPVCDVRDAATAHYMALWSKNTIGKRYICVEESHWFESFSGILSRNFDTEGF